MCFLQVGLIYRGDLISRRQLFFLDTEKVKEDETHSMVSGDLAIVDERGKLVMWCYIKKTNVCTFNTKLTGLNANKLKIGVDRTVVISNFRFGISSLRCVLSCFFHHHRFNHC